LRVSPEQREDPGEQSSRGTQGGKEVIGVYLLKTEAHFDAAHFLAGYQGKCRNIHGHRWRIEAAVEAESLNAEGQERGMVADFSEVRKSLEELADRFDHTLIYEQKSMRDETVQALEAEGFRLSEVAFRPTAENFARYFYEVLQEAGVPVSEVVVYETPKNCAIYRA